MLTVSMNIYSNCFSPLVAFCNWPGSIVGDMYDIHGVWLSYSKPGYHTIIFKAYSEFKEEFKKQNVFVAFANNKMTSVHRKANLKMWKFMFFVFRLN